MDYPRYSRAQKKGTKLTDQDVEKIVARWKAGSSKSGLAREYGVTVQAIFWVCLPKEEQERRTRLYWQRKKHAAYNSKEKRAEAAKRVRARKFDVVKDYRQYERAQAFRAKNGVERPAVLDEIDPDEIRWAAAELGGAETKKKGREYYQGIVNKRWAKHEK